MEPKENISYQVQDNESIEFNIENLLNDFENIEYQMNNNDPMYAKIVDYHYNYNVKQLVLICDYYGFSKYVKLNKLKKQDLIDQIILFENDLSNSDIVNNRKKLWFYINSLKNDKFMKKYIIWE